MKRTLKQLVILAALVGAAWLLWGERDRVAVLQNNNLRVNGTWFKFEMDRKGFDPYVFSERIITRDDIEWGSYKLRRNDVIEVMIDLELSTYTLDFPDEDHMVWLVERKGKMVPAMEWKR